MAFRSGVNQALREITTWGVVICIFSTALAYHQDLSSGLSHVVQYAEDHYKETFVSAVEQDTGFERKISIPANSLGQFYVQARINGRRTNFLADTGATLVALTHETADELGLNPNSLRYNRRTKTANGIARVAPVTLDRIEIGDITVENISAFVAEPGKLSLNLLGMSFISKLRHVELKGGHLILSQ